MPIVPECPSGSVDRIDLVLPAPGQGHDTAVIDLAERLEKGPPLATLVIVGVDGRFGAPSAAASEWAPLIAAVKAHRGLRIALIDGPISEAALDLALAVDLRLASEAATAEFGPPRDRGRRNELRRLLVAGALSRVAIDGAAWSAREATALGLWDDVMESDDLVEEASVLAGWASDVGARQVLAARAMLGG